MLFLLPKALILSVAYNSFRVHANNNTRDCLLCRQSKCIISIGCHLIRPVKKKKKKKNKNKNENKIKGKVSKSQIKIYGISKNCIIAFHQQGSL